MKKFIKKILKFIFFILFFVLIFASVFYFSRNIIVTKIIESSGTAVAGAKVDVGCLNLDIFNQKITIENFEVANRERPLTNLLQTGLIEFKFEFRPLIDKRIIIDSMNVRAVQTGTKRESSGAIPDQKDEKIKKKSSWIRDFASKQLENEKKNIPVLNPEFFKKSIDVDKIAKELNLITPVKTQEVEIYLEKRRGFWIDHLKKMDYENRLNNIRKRAELIKFSKDMSAIEIKEKIEEINRLLGEMNNIKSEIEKDKKSAKEDFKKIEEYKTNLPIWISEDYKKAKNKISLGKNNLKNTGEMIFGKRIISLGLKVFELIDKTRDIGEKTITKGDSKIERFPSPPEFWIKKIKFSGISEKIKYKGKILNITNNQNKTDFPVSIDISAKNSAYGDLKMDGNIDFRKNKKDIVFDINLKNFILRNFKISSNNLFPVIIKRGTGKLAAKIISKEEAFNAQISMTGDNFVFDKFDLKNKKDKLSMIVNSVVNSISFIKIDSRIKYDKSGSEFSIKSNLNSIFADEISKAIKKDVQVAKGKLEKIVFKNLNHEKRKFLLKISEDQKVISGGLELADKNFNLNEGNIKGIRKKLDKKLKKSGQNLFKNFKIKF